MSRLISIDKKGLNMDITNKELITTMSSTRPEYHHLYKNKAYSFVRGVVDNYGGLAGQCSQCSYYDEYNDKGEDVCPKREGVDNKDDNCLICNDDLTGVWREMKLYPMKENSIKENSIKENSIKENSIKDSTIKTTTAQRSGVKYDSGKPMYNLIPADALHEVVKVLTAGAQKYGDDNWKSLDNLDDRFFSAANRHLWAWKKGEVYDSETGCHHLAATIASIMFILQNSLDNNDKVLTV